MSCPCLVPGLGVRAWNHWGYLSNEEADSTSVPQSQYTVVQSPGQQPLHLFGLWLGKVQEADSLAVPVFLSPQVVLGMATVVTAPKGWLPLAGAGSPPQTGLWRSLGRPQLTRRRVSLWRPQGAAGRSGAHQGPQLLRRLRQGHRVFMASLGDIVRPSQKGWGHRECPGIQAQ